MVSFSQIDDLMDILSDHWQKPNAMLTLLKDSSQEQRIVAFALSYTLETTDMYGVFQNAHVVEWLRKRIFGKNRGINWYLSASRYQNQKW